MSTIDWVILISCLLGIIVYGVYKSRTTKNIDGYFLSNRSMPWYMLLLGIMGTQASAITFLTIPGQGYVNGMSFVQTYFGLPLAMIVIAFVFVPVFSKLKVVTAYEFLEQRFNANTRTLTSILFLISRGLSTGISVYAPAIVLSTLLGWNIYVTNIIMGGFLIIYTITGGANAVAHTQKIQMLLVFVMLGLTLYFIVQALPDKNLWNAISTAGAADKMNAITTGITDKGFDWKDRYNIFSGLIGGFFLSLSYFGTDHSQVGRYITGKNDKETKMGLLLNGLIKIPMQFLILLLGVLVFIFYVNTKAPVCSNTALKEKAMQTKHAASLKTLEETYEFALNNGHYAEAAKAKGYYMGIMQQALPKDDVKETNFVFLKFVMAQMPRGLVGLIMAILFLSAWGSIAAALNSLAACSVVDIHKKYFNKNCTEAQDYKIGKWYTFGWGMFCIVMSMFATNLGNSLVEAVNIVGSIFYGVILGIFLVAFFVKFVQAKAVLIATIFSQIIVIIIYKMDVIAFLWLNVIGAVLVLLLSILLQPMLKQKAPL
jgi:solute:Na+ symporter, SSS family